MTMSDAMMIPGGTPGSSQPGVIALGTMGPPPQRHAPSAMVMPSGLPGSSNYPFGWPTHWDQLERAIMANCWHQHRAQHANGLFALWQVCGHGGCLHAAHGGRCASLASGLSCLAAPTSLGSSFMPVQSQAEVMLPAPVQHYV